MLPIKRNEILPLGDYEGIRPHFRARVIEEKRLRRFSLGEHISGIFENRDTVLLQIQEMLRTERITREDAVLHEIETYSELLPGEHQVSMTCFVEIADKTLREEMLGKLALLERAFYVEVDGVRFQATSSRDEDVRDDRTTAVHYLKATLSKEAFDKLLSKTAKVEVGVAHPAYEAQCVLSKSALEALAADLSSP